MKRRNWIAAAGAALWGGGVAVAKEAGQPGGRSRDPVLDAVDAAEFGAKGDGVTDDRAALQAAIDHAITRGARRVSIGPGTYLINGTLEIRAAAHYISLELRGANGSFLGATRLLHHPSQKTNPLLNIQSSRSVRIVDIEFRGNNTAPSGQTGENYINSNPDAWVSPGVQEVRYAPYCGIAVDALAGPDPGRGNNFTFGRYGQGTSSKLSIERCRVQNFLVGIAVKPANSDSGTEDIMVRDCMLIENKYAVITTGTQQRQITLDNCNLNGHFCEFDNVTFGLRKGQPITSINCLHGKAVRLLQASGDVGQLYWSGGYVENCGSIGFIGRTPSSAAHSAAFVGVNFSLIGLNDRNKAVNKDVVLKANVPVIFTGCAVVSQFLFTIVASRGVAFESCAFRCMSRVADILPGDQENFGVFTPLGQDHLVSMRNCSQRAYSGLPKFFDDEARIAALPRRAYLMPNVTRVSRTQGRTMYKLTPPPETVSTALSGVRYLDEETLTFTETTRTPVIGKGDLLYWRVQVPVPPGEPPETALVPSVRVQDVRDNVVTCRILGHLDTTYSPAKVDIRVRLFANGVVAAGDTRAGSALIANVREASNFQAGDWIHFSNPSLHATRIERVLGSTIYCHVPLTATVKDVSIYNTLLTPL